MQRGATAIEFAFVFPILLALVYCTIVYGYLFVVRESIEFAAHKALEAAVAVDPAADDAVAQQQDAVQVSGNCSLSWLTGQACGTAGAVAGRIAISYQFGGGGVGTATCPDDYGCVTVTYYVQKDGSWVFPQLLSLPMVGTIPPMPTSMTATAVARMS